MKSGKAYASFIGLLLIGLMGFHVYTAQFGVMSPLMQRMTHLGLVLTILFLSTTFGKKAFRGERSLNLISAVLSVITMVYVWVQFEQLWTRIGAPTTLDIVLGYVLIILVLEATRRTLGWQLPLVALFFLTYVYWGQYIPGKWGHTGVSWWRLPYYMYLTTEGIAGQPLGVSATVLIIYVVFAAFFRRSGTGEFFIDLSSALFGWMRGGPAKVAVFASSLFGTFSGSAVSNVVGTGTFTIPSMKRAGYSPEFAGAVEAVSSTGGQLMPPVMGAAAFIMADVLGISYMSIVVAAVIPAILYYLGVFMGVDLEAGRTGLKGIPRSQLQRVGAVLKGRWYLLFPAVMILYLMAGLRWSAGLAGLFGIYVIVLTMICIAIKNKRIRQLPGEILASIHDGVEGALSVATATASMGIVIGVFSITGLSMKLSNLLISASGGNLFFLLVLTTIASIILGMGVPTTAAYLILAILVAPALVQMGVDPLAAHLFVFYYGMIAVITPPVAIASYAAAGIAGGNPDKTGWTAFRLGIPAYIVPFMFIYGPGLLLQGTVSIIIQTIGTSVLGIGALSVGTFGYFLRPMSFLTRLLFLCAAPFLVIPEKITDLIGIGLLVVSIIVHVIVDKKHHTPVADQRVAKEVGQ